MKNLILILLMFILIYSIYYTYNEKFDSIYKKDPLKWRDYYHCGYNNNYRNWVSGYHDSDKTKVCQNYFNKYYKDKLKNYREMALPYLARGNYVPEQNYNFTFTTLRP